MDNKEKSERDETIALAVQAGVEAAIKYIDAEHKNARERNRKAAIKRTRFFLKNYRRIQKYAQSTPPALIQSEDAWFDDVIVIGGTKMTRRRAMMVFRHILEAMLYFQTDCERSGKKQKMRQYRVIKARFIDEPGQLVREIAEQEDVEERVIYRDIEDAIGSIAVILCGIDGLPE